MDEKAITQNWLQSALESFDYNVEQGDYQSCLAVIHDIQFQGFEQEAKTLRELLRAVPLSRFAKVTPYEY